MSEDSVLHFEHAKNLFDEADQVEIPGSAESQYLALTGIGRALLAVTVELRRLNEGRDQWYREVLEVLTQAKGDDGSPRSGRPAAAPDGQEGGEG